MYRLHVHPTMQILWGSNPFTSCNRTFRSQSFFDRNKTDEVRRKKLSEQKRNCINCGILLTDKKQESYNHFCTNCMQNGKICHLCCMRTLSNELPRSDNVLFVFYDFESTQDTRFTDSATQHVPNLVYLQQFCSLCETREDIDEDCERCDKRKHSFFEEYVGDLLTHLCETQAWCERVVAIAHNVSGFAAKSMTSLRRGANVTLLRNSAGCFAC